MRKRIPLIAISLALLLLCGCSARSEAAESTPPATEAPATEATVMTEPSTETPTEAETEPTPLPALTVPGPKVYVDGVSISATALDGETVYVSAGEFAAALDGATSADGTVTLDHNGTSYTFSPDYAHIMRGQKATILQSAVLNYMGQPFLPLEEMCALMEISVFRDTEMDTLYCTPAAWSRGVAQGYDVPVLMYHAVDNDLWGIAELFVSPESMEEQLIYLTENGYDTIFFEDLYHIEDYNKPVLLTFDDGYLDNYTQLFPLLQKYNCKATVFVINQYIGNDAHYMNADQVREMASSGLVSIQSHTVTHPYLSDLDIEEQRNELEQSKLLTARMTLREPYVLCYPSGKYNDDTLAIIGDSYSFGIKMNGGLYHTDDSPFEINRYYISRYTSLSTFQSQLEAVFD